MTPVLAFMALLAERAVGYPPRLFDAIGHPVGWIGALIGWLDRTLNREHFGSSERRMFGGLVLLIVVAVAAIVGSALQIFLGPTPLGVLAAGFAASTLLAQRSLAEHVEAVADALDSAGLERGRRAVSQIVGRDTHRLDEPGVCRAAIESLAENFSDGVVAPAFWLAVGGLAGGAAYKAVNTADSMIGHKTPRHESFGWAAARFDDLVNLPASRLSALLLIAATNFVPETDSGEAWRAVWRDAKKHRSPNAGWPEAAMAGALGLSLAGPRVYDGITVDDATMGDGRREANAEDIRRALQLFHVANNLLLTIFGVLSLIVLVSG